ncbi:MAG: glutamine synthetase III [Clostridiales bacterium]|nr:glutamine synthetase III [Clostridiales bacterium]
METPSPNTVADIFGSLVFDDSSMKERLPGDIYLSLQNTRRLGLPLEPEAANVVANAMKDWAVGKGATHYTHWFQPMTNVTAEKHEALISRIEEDKVIMEFSGRELVKGEPDASSLPSGGMRSTFEARGYTAWDPTSFAFIKDGTLCIPTAFCSYGGQSLDKKTPLLRSMETINTQALRILRLFGNTTATHVDATVGAEQEYFLIDSGLCNERKDLRFTGRTLYGAHPPKNQDTAAHYFGAIRPRAAAFMGELDTELWKLGIAAKTEHNETAPSQYELAPIYNNANLAADHNQLTMEFMRKVAERHGLTCLLHEKPFAGLNGSGKHTNWSLATDDGQNLLEPGESPAENAQFLLFLCAVIKGVDDYSPLLRIAVANAGNDHRLGGDEAPPAVISIYLGDELTEVLRSIETGSAPEAQKSAYLEIGVSTLPKLPKDTTDRNRTSPLAFTGNKFEFRMTGSSDSIACVNYMMNAIVSDTLRGFADELEQAGDFRRSLQELIKKTIVAHKRILFNGNNYAEDWMVEADRRGLPNYPSAVDALPRFPDKENIRLLERHKILSEEELRFRLDILLDNYSQTISVEAQTMLDMGRQEILPAALAFSGAVSEGIQSKKSTGLALNLTYDNDLLVNLCAETGRLYAALNQLEQALAKASAISDTLGQAKAWRESVVPAMEEARAPADRLEAMVGKEYWPFPTYADLLFSV